MKQITIHIPDNKFQFFMELIKSLKFIKKVEAEDETTKEEILLGIKDAVEEVKLIKKGKMKAQPLCDFINEL